MRLAFALLAALTLAARAPLGAQQSLTVTAGERLRVTSPLFSGQAFAVSAGSDSLTVIVPNRTAPLALPLASIERVAVRERNSPARGAVRTGIKGAVVGLAVWGLSHAFVDYNERNPRSDKYSAYTRAGAFGLYVGSGAAIGAVWGALRPGSRWRQARKPVRVYVEPVETSSR